MTGTAATESSEFESIYKLKVTIVPTNKAMIRKVCKLALHRHLLLLLFLNQITDLEFEGRSKKNKT